MQKLLSAAESGNLGAATRLQYLLLVVLELATSNPMHPDSARYKYKSK
jgi:hypothetical protein